MLVFLSLLIVINWVAATTESPSIHISYEESLNFRIKSSEDQVYNTISSNEVRYSVVRFEKLLEAHGYKAEEINPFYSNDFYFEIMGDSFVATKESKYLIIYSPSEELGFQRGITSGALCRAGNLVLIIYTSFDYGFKVGQELTTIFQTFCANIETFSHNISSIHPLYKNGAVAREIGTFIITYKNGKDQVSGRYFRDWQRSGNEITIAREIVLLDKDASDEKMLGWFLQKQTPIMGQSQQ